MNFQWISLAALAALRVYDSNRAQPGSLQCDIEGRCNPDRPGRVDALGRDIFGATLNLVGTNNPYPEGPGLVETFGPMVARTALVAAAAPAGPARLLAATQEMLAPPGTRDGPLGTQFVQCGLRGNCDPDGPGRVASLARGGAQAVLNAPYAPGWAQAAAFVVTVNFPPLPKLQPGTTVRTGDYDIHCPGGMVANFGGEGGQVKIYGGRDVPVRNAWICADFPACFKVRNPFVDAPKALSGLNAMDFDLRRGYVENTGQARVEGLLKLPDGILFGHKYEGPGMNIKKDLPPLDKLQLLGAIARGIWEFTRRRFPGVFRRRQWLHWRR